MTAGEIMKAIAEKQDCGEYEVWTRAYCWHYGIPYEEDTYMPEVEMDFGNYLQTLFQEESVPVYVKSFVRVFKTTVMEA